MAEIGGGDSSNGRTADSGSVCGGSNPPSPATWRIRLAAQDAALSRRRSGVRIPYALPTNSRGAGVTGPFVFPLMNRLRVNTRFRRFWAGRLLANVAQNAILFALLVIVVNRTGSSIHASLLVLSFIMPAAVLGVVGGVVVDHLPK